MISSFHYITQDVAGYSYAQLAEQACKGKADWVQLRVKNKAYDEWKNIARQTQAICKKYRTTLIINDNVMLAKEIYADGVHLGKEDMNPSEARNILGKGFIIGGTANTIEEVKRLIEEGVDYIGIGPFRYTTTKEKLSPVLGLEGIKKLVKAYGKAIPFIAIGGIRSDDIEALMQTGIHGIAVSSAVSRADDRIEATKQFVSRVSGRNFRNSINDNSLWKI